MNEQLRDRIMRAVADLPDERGYQVLDYVEFLDSKYAERANPDNVFTRMTDKAQDILRAGKVPIDAISGTVSFFDGASKVMKGLASAAQAVVDEASKTAQGVVKPPPAPSAPAKTPPPGADPGSSPGP